MGPGLLMWKGLEMEKRRNVWEVQQENGRKGLRCDGYDGKRFGICCIYDDTESEEVSTNREEVIVQKSRDEN